MTGFSEDAISDFVSSRRIVTVESSGDHCITPDSVAEPAGKDVNLPGG